MGKQKSNGTARRVRRRRHQATRSFQLHAPPGTVHHNPDSPKPIIDVLAFGPDGFVEKRGIENPDDLLPIVGDPKNGKPRPWPVAWVNVNGLGDADTLRRGAEIFGLHHLALEDVVNTNQRSKVEEYGDHLFVVCRMNTPSRGVDTEQVSLFLGDGFVITLQERLGDCLNPLRSRVRDGRGRVRKNGADYLAYAILDAIVDGYFPLIDEFDERLDALEEEIFGHVVDEKAVVSRLHELRSDLLTIRRHLWPMGNAVTWLRREAPPAITADTRLYLRDCEDHIQRLLDLADNQRDMNNGLLDAHLSLTNYRMNEVVKVLTIIATIFIPLSFIVGLYGMNFDPNSPWNMPELHWRFGYPLVLALMGLTSAAMLYFFWRKGWIGSLGPTWREQGNDHDHGASHPGAPRPGVAPTGSKPSPKP